MTATAPAGGRAAEEPAGTIAGRVDGREPGRAAGPLASGAGKVDSQAGPPGEQVGERIRRLRTARAITQRDLAAPRYTAAYVSAVESGRRSPSGEALTHFATRLGVTVQELRTGRPPNDPVREDLLLVTAETLDGPQARAALDELPGDGVDPGRRARRLTALGRMALRQEELGPAEQHFEEAGRLLATAPPYQRVDAIAGLAACLRRRGDVRYAAYLLASLRDELLRTGYPDPGAMLVLNAHLAVCHTELEDEEQAAVSATEALALAGLADPAGTVRAHLTMARTLLADGDPGAAAIALEQARQAGRQAALRGELGWCRLARARASRAGGDLAATLADLSLAHKIFVACDLPGTALDTGIELAEVYRELGQPHRAAQLLDEAASQVGAVDSRSAPDQSLTRTARIERVRGLLAAGAGDRTAALAHLRAAFAGHRRSGPRRELARVALLLADLLDADGRPDEAAIVLRDGLAGVERLITTADRPR